MAESLAPLARICGDAFVEILGRKIMKYYCHTKVLLASSIWSRMAPHSIGLHFNDKSCANSSAIDPAVTPFPETVEQLNRYFAGSLEEFNLPIVFHGTEFQIQAWNELKKIPFGETISYKAQAERIGSVARAVGLANGQNPVSIIVPCHRCHRKPTGVRRIRWGLDRKRALLQFEATVRDFGPQPFSPQPSMTS